MQKTQQVVWSLEQIQSYQAASPFPHGIYDGLFDEEDLAAAEASFPEPEAMLGTEKFWHKYENVQEGKLEVRHKTGMPEPVKKITEILKSDEWVEELRKLTGIPDLEVDRTLAGGGMHMIPQNGRLHVHVDFNRSGDYYRRLNLLLFLNKNWKEEWHGDLQLWNDDGLVKRIWPELNRLVIFSTSDISWHGHPEPLEVPEGRMRKSIAAYYYSKEAPPGYLCDHSTVWWNDIFR
jgi:Rps23 Pro-64 3,4-dihydroxylase Tpa1-like proline 4-hydroxylase